MTNAGCLLRVLSLSSLMPLLGCPDSSGGGGERYTAQSNTVIVAVNPAAARGISRDLLGQDVWPGAALLQSGTVDDLKAQVATSLRGPMGGLVSDYCDWENPTHATSSTLPDTASISTLEFLRKARSLQASAMFTVNARGVTNTFNWPNGKTCVGDPDCHPRCTTLDSKKRCPNWHLCTTDDDCHKCYGGKCPDGKTSCSTPDGTIDDTCHPYCVSGLCPDSIVYVDANDPAQRVATLTQLAGDWVRYTNDILQRYDTGSTGIDVASTAVLDRIDWHDLQGSAQKLLDPGEARTPKVSYWEIGNEPNYPFGGLSNDPYHQDYATYADRYVTLASAMAAQGASLRIGPCVMDVDDSKNYLGELKSRGAQVDFVSTHPYASIFGWWANNSTESYPTSADAYTQAQRDVVRDQLSQLHALYQRAADRVRATYPQAELSASEWHPSSWPAAFHRKWKGRSMANALGVMESIFSFVRHGYRFAHFFTDPTFGSAASQDMNPTYRTFEFLKQHLNGVLLAAQDDALLGSWSRGYVTFDALSCGVTFWALNWGTTPVTYSFSFQSVPSLASKAYLATTYSLSAQSLFHGAVCPNGTCPAADQDQGKYPNAGAPNTCDGAGTCVLTAPLAVQQESQGLPLNTLDGFTIDVPPASWRVVKAELADPSQCYKVYLPIVNR
jgi:hypothetical protein